MCGSWLASAEHPHRLTPTLSALDLEECAAFSQGTASHPDTCRVSLSVTAVEDPEEANCFPVEGSQPAWKPHLLEADSVGTSLEEKKGVRPGVPGV